MTDPLGPLPPEISRALAALPPPPPPPPVEAVLAHLQDAPSRRVPAGLAIAAGLVIVLGGSWIAMRPRDVGPVSGALFARDGRRAITDRVEVEARDVAYIGVESPDRLRLSSGTATFHVRHRDGAPVRVRAREVEIIDVGTTFTVEVGEASAPTLVTVDDGAVEANGVRVPAGFGLGFTGKTAGGAPWRLDAKPAVALERGDAPARVGTPVELRLVLSNPTDRWMTLPAPDPLGAPLFVEVTDPNGATTPVRVTPSMGVDFDRLKAGIPPRGRTAVGVRFDSTFASKGTYRLRVVVQPAGTTDQPRSEELVLEIR